MKEMVGRAAFMNAIHHEENLTHFTGVRTDWHIEGILFNIEGCDYSVSNDDGFSMHEIKFSDGSECYFEVLFDGTLSHFMANAFVEVRGGFLVVSSRSTFEDSRRAQRGGVATHVGGRGRSTREHRIVEVE
ncbi:hypothetical protein IF803_39905 [Bradyrhizobium sp. UFLA06-06]